MAVLFIAGDQFPVIPFVDVVCSVIVPPEHIGATALKAGIVGELTFTVIVAVVAH